MEFRLFPNGTLPLGPLSCGFKGWAGDLGKCHLAWAEGCGGKHRAPPVGPGASYCSSLSLSFPMCTNRLTAPSLEELLEVLKEGALKHSSRFPAFLL